MKVSFEIWMAKVDAALEAKVSMASLDLPDVDYHDMYDDGKTPTMAANKAIRSAKGEMW